MQETCIYVSLDVFFYLYEGTRNKFASTDYLSTAAAMLITRFQCTSTQHLRKRFVWELLKDVEYVENSSCSVGTGWATFSEWKGTGRPDRSN